jgi:hypothetical protein
MVGGTADECHKRLHMIFQDFDDFYATVCSNFAPFIFDLLQFMDTDVMSLGSAFNFK